MFKKKPKQEKDIEKAAKELESELITSKEKKDSIKAATNSEQIKYDKETLSKIKSERDKVEEKNKKILPKVYDYWVYIFKDGEQIGNFGVKLELFKKTKLLIRKEKDSKGEDKVVFAEIFPEAGWDLSTVQTNKTELKNKLNKLYQIKRYLEKKQFSKEKEVLNYDLSDVNLEIQDLELKLDSISHGVRVDYFWKIRNDGIKCLFYELNNSGLILLKRVKETNVVKEASEVKKLGTGTIHDTINDIFPSSKARNWLQIAAIGLVVVLVGLLLWGVISFFNINEEKQYGQFRERLAEISLQCQEIATESQKALPDSIDRLTNKYDEIIRSCIEPENTIPRDERGRAIVN